jgi:hypothetical protein
MKRLALMMGLLFVSISLSSCSANKSETRTLLVPGEFTTIQQAVDEANFGDLVLISPGVYHEAIKVDRDGVVIRGLNRNDVIIDGKDDLINGFEISTNSVAIENLTVRSFRQNGIIFSGALRERGNDYDPYGSESNSLDGYRVSYVTSYNNGLYGIYAFASRNGLIEHSYASGHPDSGLYVGQCSPCNVVIRSSVAENNAIGYYGTNASTNVWVVESIFKGNRLGITPNSQEAEMLSPQQGATVAANLVVDNDNRDAPAIPKGFFGGGIVVGGGLSNLVTRNVISGHSWAGIAIMPMSKILPMKNRIIENEVQGNGTDLVFVGAPADTSKNCFSANMFSTSAPKNIEKVLSCNASSSLKETYLYSQPAELDGPNYRDVAVPPKQSNMPNAAKAPLNLPIGEPLYPSVAELTAPVLKQ